MFQIFTGTVVAGQLTELKYGQNSTRTAGNAISQDDISKLNGISDAGDTQVQDQADITAMAEFVNLNGTAFKTVSKNTPATGVPSGYYLIRDTANSPTDSKESKTLYLMQVINDDVTITPKSSTTTEIKKVKDINDSEDASVGAAQDSADYDIGDKVPFVLTATLAGNVTSYYKYHIDFTDTLEAGKLKNNKDYVVKVNGTQVFKETDEGHSEDTFVYTVTDSDNGFTSLRLEWGDGVNLISDSSLNNASVTVEFTAELLAAANIGAEGNVNTSTLKFSNNPNDKDGGDEGETPEDTVIVFTYRAVVDKTDEAGTALTGATFSLYKKYVTAPQGGTACTEAGYSDYYLVETINTGSTFSFDGIDDGTYLLVEDEAPQGYNKIAPQEFKVTATHTAEADIDKTSKKDTKTNDYVLTDINGDPLNGATIQLGVHTTNNKKDGVSTSVVNKSGATLPETGGIGTTIFYVAGSIMVLAAAILLITKRRMGNND